MGPGSLSAHAASVYLPMQGRQFALAIGSSGIDRSANGIVTTFASSASATTLSGGGLTGSVQTPFPQRNIAITTSTSTNINAVGVVLIGTDYRGRTIQETITLTNNGNAVDEGLLLFAGLTSAYFPAQGGAGGSIQIGWGRLFGLEPWIGEYVEIDCDQTWSLNTAAPGSSLTAPVHGTTGHAANNARVLIYPASTPRPFLVDAQRAAVRAQAAATGTLRVRAA